VHSKTNDLPAHLKNNHIPLACQDFNSMARLDAPVEEHLFSKTLDRDSFRRPLSLLLSLRSPTDWLSEILYTIKPMVYVLFLLRRKKNSWNPLAVSLFIDLTSRTLRPKPKPSCSLERSEFARRDRDLLWYLLRGDVWKHYSRPKFEYVAQNVSRVPIIGLLGLFLQEWIPLIDNYYYYTAP